MAGADKLTQKILEEARLQARANVERAETEAAAIIESAGREGAARAEVLMGKAEREAAERKRRMASVAELEGRKLKLQTKQELIEEVFSQSIEALNQMPLERYTGILAEMIAFAAVTGDEAVVLSEKDKKRLGNDFIKNINAGLKSMGKIGGISLAEETRDIGGGFILKRENIEINSSFEAIIRMRRDELEAEVVKVLFTTML